MKNSKLEGIFYKYRLSNLLIFIVKIPSSVCLSFYCIYINKQNKG